MDSATIKAKANALFAEAPFVSRIGNSNDHQQALSLMDELIKDYETNRLLIEVLAAFIERWEERAPGLADFNARVAILDGDEAVLRVLMDQYQLKPSDLEPELGARGSVSGLLAGRYKLTCAQIEALSDRFGFNPEVFFRKV